MVQFKTEDLEKEWWTSGHIHPYLRSLHYYLAFYCEIEFRKRWIITCIERSKQNQIDLYPEYYKKFGKPKPSLHCVKPVQAIDSRSHHLTKEEIEELKDIAFKYWLKALFNMWGFRWHKKDGYHIHTQVKEWEGQFG